MNKNLVTIIIAFSLVGLGLYFYFGKGSGSIKEELKDFAVEDTAAINKIFMADRNGNTVTLVRQSSSDWTVNGKYDTRKDAIKTLLTTIRRVEVQSPVQKAAYENVIKNLATMATKVEIYMHGESKPAKVYYVGGATQSQLGTFMILENSSAPFITQIGGFNGYLTPRYFLNENEWRSRVLFYYDFNQIKTVSLQNNVEAHESFRIQDAGTQIYALYGTDSSSPDEKADRAKVRAYIDYFAGINYEGFDTAVEEAIKDSIIKAGPFVVLMVEDKSGKQKVVRFFHMPVNKRSVMQTDREGNPLPWDRERMYALVDNDTDFIVVQNYALDKILKRKSEFYVVKNPS